MSEYMPQHLLALVTTGIILHRHARAVLAYAGDLDVTAGDARPERPGERRAPHRRGEDDGYSQDSQQARQRAEDSRAEMGTGRAAIMRRCGVDGKSFRQTAEELRYSDEGQVCDQFKRACDDLLRIYHEFAEVAPIKSEAPEPEPRTTAFDAQDGRVVIDAQPDISRGEESALRTLVNVDRWRNLTVAQYVALARERGVERHVRVQAREGLTW